MLKTQMLNIQINVASAVKMILIAKDKFTYDDLYKMIDEYFNTGRSVLDYNQFLSTMVDRQFLTKDPYERYEATPLLKAFLDG